MKSTNTFSIIYKAIQTWNRHRKFKKHVTKGECTDISDDQMHLYYFDKDGYPHMRQQHVVMITVYDKYN